jgi:hypothetical protein
MELVRHLINGSKAAAAVLVVTITIIKITQ